jgi:vancomycin resistance protein YoaR
VQAESWTSEARLARLRVRRQRQARLRMVRRLGVAGLGVATVMIIAVAFVYAGSPNTLPSGVEIAGVDVAGLSSTEAVRRLELREASLRSVPLTVEIDDRTYDVRPADLGLNIDWRAAVARAQEKTDGVRPLRGLRRLATWAFGTDVTPTAVVNPRALARVLAPMAANDVAYRDAAIRLAGLRPVVVPERSGLALDKEAAATAIVSTLASLDRTPVKLSTGTAEPKVTAEMLAPVADKVRTAVSRPVKLVSGNGFTLVPRRRIAKLLDLPSGGERALRIGGPAADAYFAKLAKTINTRPQNADFVIADSGRVVIKPAVNARAVDVPRTAKGLYAAALRPERRSAQIVVGTKEPARTTAEAKKMGITGLVGGYTTIYTGDANRVHNVQLVANLIDHTLIPPGHVFSFNGTTGERNADKGFLEAPVIINGELGTGLGGGVCQVSTTVFNAAYEAGLDITERTNHALYISHYPQGRDATVNYPDTDLKFVNDTNRWLLLRTFVGSSSLTVDLYGAPRNRRVESEVAPLEVVGKPPTTWRKDPTITQGRRVVADAGSSPLATSVNRKVYDAKGKLLYDDTWYSSYRGEKKIVLVGTKPKAEPKPKPEEKPAAEEGAPPVDEPAPPPVDRGPGT